MRLKNKVAIVTGAASGIGRGIAYHFAREGARVIVADKDESGAVESAETISSEHGTAAPIFVDISDEDQVRELVEQAAHQFDHVDILVNSAAIDQTVTPLAEMDVADWDRIMSVNLRGTFLCCRYVLPVMLEAGGGVILNIASDLGYVVVPGLGAYCSSKGGILQLTRSLAAEYGPDNIRSNAICPTMIDTPMAQRTLATHPEPDTWKSEVEQAIPLRRIGTVDDVVGAALFLASDAAQYITGVCLPVDGGRTVL